MVELSNKNLPIIFMIGGQGSQYYQMGIKLYQNNYIFKKWLCKCSEIVKNFDSDIDLIDQIYNNPFHLPFKELKYTHPAVVCIEYALYKTLIEEGIKPDYVLGSSLGEFTASIIVEAVSLEEGLRLVLKHAETIKKHCAKGGMTVVLGPIELIEKLDLNQKITIAGINFNNHFIIAGLLHELNHVENYLKQKEIHFQRLPVEYGFHSSGIDRAELEFKDYCRKFNFNYPKIPMLSGLDVKQIKQISQDYLWEVTRKPLNFQKIILNLEESLKAIYIDLTPNSTLANFVKYNISSDSESKYFSIFSAFNMEFKNLEMIKKEYYCR